MKENCHNSRTSDDIDIKLGPVTKLDIRTKKKSEKKWMMMSCQKIVISPFFGFLASLEQSGGWIPDTVCKMYVFINSNLLSYKN